jgi:hypothetical protein
MAIKLGEQTIFNRVEDARLEVRKAGAAYDAAVRALSAFDENARHMVQDENVAQRRQILMNERTEAWRILGDANLVLNWMLGEAKKNRTDNGDPRIKD